MAPGIELFEHINEYMDRNKRVLGPKPAMEIFEKIVHAVADCHGKGYAHRDLKPENIYIDFDLNGHPIITLLDFGMACEVQEDITGKISPAKTSCGSLQYAAPEVLRGEKYNAKKADIWSLGVTLYVLLVGAFPYKVENGPKLFKWFDSDQFSIQVPESIEKPLSELIRDMMKRDPEKRITLDTALERIQAFWATVSQTPKSADSKDNEESKTPIYTNTTPDSSPSFQTPIPNNNLLNEFAELGINEGD